MFYLNYTFLSHMVIFYSKNTACLNNNMVLLLLISLKSNSNML